MINGRTNLRRVAWAALIALSLFACDDGEDPSHGDSQVEIPTTGMDATIANDATVEVDTPDVRVACAGPGCACREDSEPMNCYPSPIVTPTGTTLCAQGSMYCRDGVWSSCESLIQFGLQSKPVSSASPSSSNKSNGSGLSGITSALITPPTKCDTCHPNCFQAVDTPVATDLTSSNTNANDAGTTLVTYDPVQAGIRLTILSDTAQRGPLLSLAVCGNSAVEDVEQCDDGNTRAGDGCDATCVLETGYFCPTPGMACARSVCGNAAKEGLEGCDDGNQQIGDGCTPQCVLEPSCASGSACTPVCGDGKVFPTEPCDDGNLKSGDGCSSTCALEGNGFYCTNATMAPPAYIDLPIVYRDFAGTGLVTTAGKVAPSKVHNDFQNKNGGLKTGMVNTTWDSNSTKATYKKPVASTPLITAQLTSKAAFDQWYTDDPSVNITFADTLRVLLLTSTPPTYQFSSNSFFPLDGKSGTWVTQGMESKGADGSGVLRNFSFTSEVRFWFVYNPSPVAQLDFYGDDDVWVFINGVLAVDIGGVHGQSAGSVKLDATAATKFNLTSGNLYEAAVFQAERHTSGSNYKLTLAGFFSGKTTCTTKCGDGYVTPDEFCDDGASNGLVGFCLPDCQGRAPKYASSASYWRDYAATTTCKIPPERPLWGSLVWKTIALSGGTITFQLQGAETAAAVPTAAVVSVPIVVSAGSGSFNIQQALAAAGQQADPPYLRVTALLASTVDQRQTPVLNSFDVSHTCVNVE